jgi:N-acetyl-gamma-glutamyl-phosphate reductase
LINVSVIGANGYTGLELMCILAGHKSVCVKHLVSRSNAGHAVCEFYPNLYPYEGKVFEDLNIDAIVSDSDVVFTALPHAASAEICKKFYEKGVKVIDLSADFRYKDISVYEKWYGPHPDPEMNKKAVYGLPEIYREKIKAAPVIGNPGCYTTCSILPLYPLLKEKLINPDTVVIDAKSGTSGAGRKAESSLLFCEVNENFKAYSLTNHRHTSEIEQELSIAAGKDIMLSFNPHLLPVQRGILCTIYCDVSRDISGETVYEAYKKYYGKEPFVIINKEGVLPELKHVRHTNYISIGYAVDKRLNKLIIVSVIDNITKGASGQAVQNMNIMFGINEKEGLENISKYI